MKKRLYVLLLVAVFGVIVLKNMFNPYAKISRYVNHNEGNLRASCEFYLEQKHVNKAGTEIDVMGIYGGEHKIVQFFYSGKGIAPASVYYGFYYSPDDIPVPYCNGNEELKMVSEDEWTWEDIGDNGGRIRKIQDKRSASKNNEKNCSNWLSWKWKKYIFQSIKCPNRNSVVSFRHDVLECR